MKDPTLTVESATLIVTATTSTEPVLPEDMCEDAFVATVASFTPVAAEIPAALAARSTVVVDTVEGAEEEAGDLLLAEKAGVFRWEDAVSLHDGAFVDGASGGPCALREHRPRGQVPGRGPRRVQPGIAGPKKVIELSGD